MSKLDLTLDPNWGCSDKDADDRTEGDVWFMPRGGTLDIPSARNAEDAERIVEEALSKDPRIQVANPVTLIEMEGD
jgi:hypothetical protein|tara:strand:- start:606 stop:833 length:228 start_codon:yes stop_codon:yes gene_type:complete